jgi:methanogenic corrinoid protein MtbC1
MDIPVNWVYRKGHSMMHDSMDRKYPLFNLNAVVKETGLKPDVLRAWERRYGLPNPLRSSGGHRLYSRLDIDTLKWLRARQVEGLGIHRATDLWKELTAAGKDPLNVYGSARTSLPYGPPAESLQIGDLSNRWLEACLTFNRRMADDVLNEALALYPVERICTDLLQPALSEVGDRWYRGLATVQQEHFTSAQVLRRVEALINATPDPTRKQTVIIGCPSGELHTYPTLFLSLMLRRRGYKVIDLGADTPIEQMQPTIATIQPDLVIMAAQQLTSAAEILKAAHSLHAWNIVFAYGGLIFNRIPSLRRQIPAIFLGENLAQALLSIDSLLTGAMNLAIDRTDTFTNHDLAKLFADKRPRIELQTFDRMAKAGIAIDQINEINTYLGEKLAAALTFGDPTLVETDLIWLWGFLSNRSIPTDSLHLYLHSYNQAIGSEMGAGGEVISNWLDDSETKGING